MRFFLSPRCPDVSRIVVVESGSRHVVEQILPFLRSQFGGVVIDLVTCYAGLPNGLDGGSVGVFRVGEYRGKEGRARLYRELKRHRPSVLVMICSAEPVMTKWKWALAWHLPCKVLIVNENGDCFWLDRANWRTACHFVLFRAGLTGADAVPTLLRVASFPLTVTYLLLYAAVIHLRRKVHG